MHGTPGNKAPLTFGFWLGWVVEAPGEEMVRLDPVAVSLREVSRALAKMAVSLQGRLFRCQTSASHFPLNLQKLLPLALPDRNFPIPCWPSHV